MTSCPDIFTVRLKEVRVREEDVQFDGNSTPVSLRSLALSRGAKGGGRWR